MKKYVLILVAVCILGIPFTAFAEAEWKQNFASPSYGLVIFPSRIERNWIQGVDSGLEEQSFLTPAVDLRIFRGVNVSRRGGFYSGVEAGALIFVPMSQSFTDSVTIHTFQAGDVTFSDFNFNLEVNGGIVFLMAKYGLRIDIGPALFGLGLGADLGMGASLYSGGFELYAGDRDEGVSTSWGASGASMGLIVNSGVEGALRLGRNFRFFANAGVIIVPVSYPNNQTWEENQWVLDDQNPSPRDLQRYALSNYNVNIDAFGFGARFGFVLNY